jgi:predicted enzyme related to lactoylglutathione lyase
MWKTDAMSLQLLAVTFDCANAAAVAEFWSSALDRPIDREGDMAASDFFARIQGDGSTPTLMFIQVPEPKTVKNRVHLDLHADDRSAEVGRLVGLGATIVHEKAEFGVEWTTLADPEGNEFCVAAH